ncbi:DUF4349 domain-containing protein [Actinosynnema sp. NPDC059335]|uniref:DUF4349 domain-containing protein n=1 Tax=Actinosynnema sp. NPDC059335 TaxID=3346804 RepID=UPI00366DFB84
MGRRVGLVAAAFAVVALAGCGANGSGESSAADRAAVAPEVASPQQGGTPPARDSSGEARQADTASARDGRQLVRTATVELRAADSSAVMGRVTDLVGGEGGYAAQEKSQPDRATVTFKVPGDRLDRVLTAIAALEGVQVVKRELTTEDVTEQIVDVEARLANQRASVERVRGLLERATTTAEITDVEAELTKRQAELESLQRRYETLKGQVALSTLTVTVSAAGASVVVEEEDDFLSAFAGGWHALVDAFAWLLVVLGAVLPFAVVLGLPVLGYWWRRRRRRVAAPATGAS